MAAPMPCGPPLRHAVATSISGWCIATTALEALRSGNRMVCLITHVRELAERMPVRIEVVKTHGGSRIVANQV